MGVTHNIIGKMETGKPFIFEEKKETYYKMSPEYAFFFGFYQNNTDLIGKLPLNFTLFAY